MSALSNETKHEPWWLLVLMYPTLAVSLIGAVPQYSQWAWNLWHGYAIGSDVATMKAKLAAWTRNRTCVEGTVEHIRPRSETTYTIELTPCPSGDILVTVIPDRDPDLQNSDWVFTRDILRQSGLSAVGRALAQPKEGSGGERSYVTRVLSVTTTGNTVVRRVELSNNSCEDQMIDGYTGKLVSRQPAPCNG